jgi:spoIIIJ-associated protein
VTRELSVETTGETVGEAKWRALRELELLSASLDKDSVRFQVLSEGRRGLLGVGYEPARVLATADAVTRDGEAAAPVDESEDAGRLRELLEHVTAAMGVRCRIDVTEAETRLVGSCVGDDLGLLIGRHGGTIDAVQALANAIIGRGEQERKEIVVDAAGYRDRRRRALDALALRSAEEALRDGARVALEPMAAAERKLVHERLKEVDGVTTASEGDEPHRYVVVEPA